MVTTAERFLRHVRVTPGCHLWTGATFDSGYGRFVLDDRDQRAHRVAWLLATGEDPGEAHVLHACDVKLCVRVHPDHLHLGDHAKNMREASERGLLRQPRDCGHPDEVKWLMDNGRWRCRTCHAESEARRLAGVRRAESS